MTYTANEQGNVDEDGKLYAVAFGESGTVTIKYQAEMRARAERIAACLEFCEGVPNEQLKIGTFNDFYIKVEKLVTKFEGKR